jgi:hypothetical protein
MAYIGRSIEYGNAVVDHFVGNGGATYTLNYDTNTDGVVISLDGVVQKNGTDFNITGTSLVFTSVVASPIEIQVVYTGLTLSFPTPSDGSVTDAKIVDMAASKLTGTIADARFPATLPAISGANLTNLPSDITKSTSEPTATINPSGGVGTLYLRTTTGEMYCCTDATTDANIWTNIGDGTGTVPNPYMTATGGTITTDGDYKVHTFTSSGTFTPAIGGAGVGDFVDYLVIAGGGSGSGGLNALGGAGGAGGYRNSYSSETSGGGGASETALAVTSSSYTVTIGAGGAAVSGSTLGNQGSNSVFGSVTSVGGGRGGYNNTNGAVGGSGGGAGMSTSQNRQGGAGTANQGYAGGDTGIYPGGGYYAHAGAGGAGAVGASITGATGTGGVGGAGLASSITGSSVTRAGGGGGFGSTVGGAGGSGGGTQGGNNGSYIVLNATVNTGSGGGGGTQTSPSGSGAGGSGVVIIRYKFQ